MSLYREKILFNKRNIYHIYFINSFRNGVSVMFLDIDSD